MVGKALLLLADVELLDIVDKLLLKAVFVVLNLGDGTQSVNDASANLLHARLLVRLNALQQSLYVVYLLAELLLQRRTLLLAERHERIDSLVDSLARHRPLLVGERLYLHLRHHIRHAQQREEPVARQRNLALRSHVLNLFAVVLRKRCVDSRGVGRSVLFNPDREVDLAANHLRLYSLTNLHLLLSVERSDASREVERLTVERLYLDIDFLTIVDYDRLAVAGH